MNKTTKQRILYTGKVKKPNNNRMKPSPVDKAVWFGIGFSCMAIVFWLLEGIVNTLCR